MFSPPNIAKGTVAALAVGVIAAPVASARPIDFAPVAQARHAQTAPAPAYSRQDKQLIPSSPSQSPVAAPAAPRATTPSGGFDWTYVGIGAGGGLVLLLGAGGALTVAQRRRVTASAVATS